MLRIIKIYREIPMLTRTTDAEKPCIGCSEVFTITNGDQTALRGHQLICKGVKKKYVRMPKLFWEMVVVMRESSGRLNTHESNICNMVPASPELAWKGRILPPFKFPHAMKAKDKTESNKDGSSAGEKKRTRKGDIVPRMKKSEMTTLYEITEISGAAFTCDEDQGIQETPKTEKNGRLVGLPEKLRRFHHQLREAERQKTIPPRPDGSGLWNWPNDAPLQKIIPILHHHFTHARYRCKFYLEAGPSGTHACMSQSIATLPLLLKIDDDSFHMLNYEPEKRDARSSATTTCAEMGAVIEAAPKGRWFFFGGKIPKDMSDLLAPLVELGLTVTVDPEHTYFLAVGIKGAPLYDFLDMSESWMSGTGRICMAQHLHKLKKKENLEPIAAGDDMPKCYNCRRVLFIAN
eukprot:GEMP01014248.1.p1 GENE.GEMP01014248.1~~GEMP01014248.1.p1  ORF type:complete len:405 (+),score=76.41 GEMP01014248.1:161-1375(+)